MSAYFKRQLTDYVEYHRDPFNCALHVFGIIFLFLAAVLPLSLWPIYGFGVQTTLATIMVLPVLIYWLLLDAALGMGILTVAILLLLTAATIVNHASVVVVWIISAVLIVIGAASQIIGHQYFERRKPALMDNPSHLLLGPMFVMAKLFIALGFRHDLGVVLQQVPQRTPLSTSPHPGEDPSKPRPNL
jgi:uncharacterized membrane protein YGL010W